MKTIMTLALAILALSVVGLSFADQKSFRSEFRIYYHNDSGLVFDQGYGINEYNDAVAYMNKHASPRNDWVRFKPLCGKMFEKVNCAKFDKDTNRPGADYFCNHLPEYENDVLKDMDHWDINAIQDLCEAHYAKSVRSMRMKNKNPKPMVEK